MTTPTSLPTAALPTRGQLPVLRLSGAQAALEITPHGAHVLAWEPAHTRPVLFLSPQSSFSPGKAIRGGVPLVFPWFGPRPGEAGAAQHGFARVREWQVEGARVEANGTAYGEFSLTSDERTRAVWPHAFAARLVVRAGRELHLALEVRNRGVELFRFEAAFHSYFAVSDVRQIAVHGLAHTEFVERYGGRGRQRQGVEPITFAGEVDRSYLNTTGTCLIEDHGWKRRIVVAKAGSRTTVVWNPGADKARAMADLGDPAWTGFVCVETVCAADDAITLAPGATHTLSATIAVEQEE